MSKPKPKPKEIVEYRHCAPVKVPAEDALPEAMFEVIRRIELVLDPRRGVLSEALSRDICRLLASREREWMRADRAERTQEHAYLAGRRDAFRAMQRDRELALIAEAATSSRTARPATARARTPTASAASAPTTRIARDGDGTDQTPQAIG